MRFVRNPLVWIGLAISIVALLLAFRGMHWGEVRDSIVDANYGLLALAVVVLLLAFYVRAARWAVLFRPRAGLRMAHLFGALNIGYGLNNLLPLRVGELGRTYLICETEGVDAGRALSTVVVERTLDTLTVVALLFITLPFIDAPDWVRTRAPFVAVGFLGIALLLAIMSAAPERTMVFVRRIARVLPRVVADRAEPAVESGLEGFAVFRRPGILAPAVFWSAVSWLLSALVTYVMIEAFGLDLPFSAALFITCATSLGMVVPSSPGYVGVFHAIAIESLVKVFDADRSTAASFALLLHAVLYLTPIAVSVAYLALERGTWQDIRLWAAGERASLAVEGVDGDP